MDNSTNQGEWNRATSDFDEKLARFILIDPGRRRLLIALADGKARSPSQLANLIGSNTELTFKQLERMRKKGLVFRKPDPTDGRRWLYQLSASIPIKMTPEGKVIDFGYIGIPLK